MSSKVPEPVKFHKRMVTKGNVDSVFGDHQFVLVFYVPMTYVPNPNEAMFINS